MSKQRKVIINNNYYGKPSGADSHMIRTDKEKKTVENQSGIASDDKTIVDWQKAAFEDFSKKANDFFKTSGNCNEVMSEQTTHTVFTDAYSTECIAPIAMKWYEKFHMHVPENFLKFDPVAFIAYCEATAQLVLMSNDEIVGVNGFTRQMVGDAKALLEDWYIPECVSIAIQGFRPIAVIDTDCKFVLLPYQYQTAAGLQIANQFTFVPRAGRVPAHFDAVLTPASFWRKEIGQAPVQLPIVIAPGDFRRRSLFLNYMDLQAAGMLPLGAQSVTAAIVNQFVGHTVTSLSCAGYDLFGPMFRRNVIVVRNVYETVNAISDKLLKMSNVCKLATGLATQTFHVARLKDRLPIQISNLIGAGDNVSWMEYEPQEKLTPWFIAGTYAGITRMALQLMHSTGMFFPVIRPPRQEWLNNERFLTFADAIAMLIKGQSGAFTALRSHLGF